MKLFFRKLFVLFFVLFISIPIEAQDFQGKAYYMSKTDVDMSNFGRPDMSEDQKKRMAERLKSMFEKTYILSFNKIESIYKVEEQLEAPTAGRGGGFSNIMSGAIDGIKYKNVKSNQFLSEHELFGKLFLIKEDLQKMEWKMTGETKQIGSYTCFKATTIKTWQDFDISSLRRPPNRDENKADENKQPEPVTPKKVEVVAWYTMQIPVSQGPGDFWGLPGLILEVNTDKTTILCTKIVLNPSEKFTIKPPSKGKVVSKEEYVEIATEKYKEMRENFRRGGGGRR
ncbi:GLPGLI family protein [Algibacter mikhailovii]|uniref:GLPGLI family protein n=1 Tax=Algibacter mikhailovii TaxID=425498 RepID=A0A918VDC5_9FLAO|nr:GLPGLI family protein [Algibacter mikhailovii]GGZ90773.1 GLPGLI family protein [Algibacter mikhailovii]